MCGSGNGYENAYYSLGYRGDWLSLVLGIALALVSGYVAYSFFKNKRRAQQANSGLNIADEVPKDNL